MKDVLEIYHMSYDPGRSTSNVASRQQEGKIFASMIMTMSCLNGIPLPSFPYLDGPYDLGWFRGGKYLLTPMIIPCHPADQSKRLHVAFRRISRG
jgi:hypothetical protein